MLAPLLPQVYNNNPALCCQCCWPTTTATVTEELWRCLPVTPTTTSSSSTSPSCLFDVLSEEVLIHILTFVSVEDICLRYCLVSRQFSELCSNEFLWKEKCFLRAAANAHSHDHASTASSPSSSTSTSTTNTLRSWLVRDASDSDRIAFARFQKDNDDAHKPWKQIYAERYWTCFRTEVSPTELQITEGGLAMTRVGIQGGGYSGRDDRIAIGSVGYSGDGSYHWEFLVTSEATETSPIHTSFNIGIAVLNGTASLNQNIFLGHSPLTWSYYSRGSVWNGNRGIGLADERKSYGHNDVIGLHLKIESQSQLQSPPAATLTFFRNGDKMSTIDLCYYHHHLPKEKIDTNSGVGRVKFFPAVSLRGGGDKVRLLRFTCAPLEDTPKPPCT